MVNIDALLSEWAYRCKKGYPDMDSPSDLKVLKNILKEQNIVLPEQQLSLFSDEEMEKLLVKGVGKPIEKQILMMKKYRMPLNI
jgi:beta-galactosidase beta subunit